MYKILPVCAILLLAGCGNLSPKLQQKVDNQGGQIDEIRNNQNGISLELGKVRQSAEIQNSQLKEVQNGMVNLNAAVSRNENSGIQILQGDGALIMVFALAVIAMLLHYRNRAVKSEKAAMILAQEVAGYNDPDLHGEVLKAAMNTDAEKEVYHLLTKFRN